MDNTLKRVLYMVIAAVITVGAIFAFIWILPYLLLIGAIIFIYFKLKGNSIKKKTMNTSNSYEKTYNTTNNSEYSASQEDDVTADVIDVEYKEID